MTTSPHHRYSYYRYNDHSKTQPLGNSPWPLQTKHYLVQVILERDIARLAMNPKGFVDATHSGDQGGISETCPNGDYDPKKRHDDEQQKNNPAHP